MSLESGYRFVKLLIYLQRPQEKIIGDIYTICIVALVSVICFCAVHFRYVPPTTSKSRRGTPYLSSHSATAPTAPSRSSGVALPQPVRSFPAQTIVTVSYGSACHSVASTCQKFFWRYLCVKEAPPTGSTRTLAWPSSLTPFSAACPLSCACRLDFFLDIIYQKEDCGNMVSVFHYGSAGLFCH